VYLINVYNFSFIIIDKFYENEYIIKNSDTLIQKLIIMESSSEAVNCWEHRTGVSFIYESNSFPTVPMLVSYIAFQCVNWIDDKIPIITILKKTFEPIPNAIKLHYWHNDNSSRYLRILLRNNNIPPTSRIWWNIFKNC